MALKFSEMVTLRFDLARNLEAGFDNYTEEISNGYSSYVSPLLEEGEVAPDIGLQLQLMKRSLAQGRERLKNFNDPVFVQTHEEARVRAELERRQNALDAKIRLARHICRGFYGRAGVERLGLKEDPPRSAPRLHEHGVTVKASLEKPDLGLEPLMSIDTGEGVAPPQAQIAAQLEPELSELGELVGERHQENRRTTDVRLQRKRAIQEFDRELRAVVRTTQGLFRLAGRDDLAERFRPILQRVVRRIRKAQADEAAAEAENGATTEGGEAAPESTESAAPETSA